MTQSCTPAWKSGYTRSTFTLLKTFSCWGQLSLLLSKLPFCSLDNRTVVVVYRYSLSRRAAGFWAVATEVDISRPIARGESLPYCVKTCSQIVDWSVRSSASSLIYHYEMARERRAEGLAHVVNTDGDGKYSSGLPSLSTQRLLRALAKMLNIFLQSSISSPV
jgi:hypothetical protein